MTCCSPCVREQAHTHQWLTLGERKIQPVLDGRAGSRAQVFIDRQRLCLHEGCLLTHAPGIGRGGMHIADPDMGGTQHGVFALQRVKG
jgi:hypothetical protein